MSRHAPFRDRAVAFVIASYGITIEELLSRRQSLAEARALFAWIVREYRPDLSDSQLARWMGFHHTSIPYLLAKANALRATNPRFLDRCERFAAAYRRTGEIPYACA